MAKFKRQTSLGKALFFPDGERYVFKGGRAKVPGVKTSISGKPVYITLEEFNRLNEEEIKRRESENNILASQE